MQFVQSNEILFTQSNQSRILWKCVHFVCVQLKRVHKSNIYIFLVFTKITTEIANHHYCSRVQAERVYSS